MNLAEIALFLIALLFLILVVFRLFSAPLKLTLKLLLNTAIGFFALILLDLFSPLLGLHLGVNLTNAFGPAGLCSSALDAMGVPFVNTYRRLYPQAALFL